MRRIDCIGMIGKLPTPEGLENFWDTGKKVDEDAKNKLKALQFAYFNAPENVKKDISAKLLSVTNQIMKEFNVYPVKFAGIDDDGRIVTNTPWYEEKEGEN